MLRKGAEEVQRKSVERVSVSEEVHRRMKEVPKLQREEAEHVRLMEGGELRTSAAGQV